MTGLNRWHGPGNFLVVASIGVLSACSILGQPARAADAEKANGKLGGVGSLRWIPDNASFYSAMLRNREQFQAIAKSRAWAKLTALPFVQEQWKKVQAELREGGKLAPLAKFYQDPANRELVALLGDMFGEEVFCYAGPNWVALTDLGQEITGAMVGAYMQLAFAGPRQRTEIMATAWLDALKENLKLLQVPDLVMGFKLSKADRAEAQLKRLEALLHALTQNHPQLKGRVKRDKVGEASFLTLRLDGSLVPWEAVPFKQFEKKEGDYDALIKHLQKAQLTLSAGVRDGYLLFSLGKTNAHLAKLGQGKRLADRAEFKPLAKFADRPLVAIDYRSQALNAKQGLEKKDVDNLVEMVKGILPADLPEKQRERILKDLKDLSKDLKQFIPVPGANLQFTFLSNRGYESYEYDWGKYPDRDGSKPLTLLQHVGGAPVLATVGRSKVSVEQYQLLVKWITVAIGYMEEFGLAQLPDEVKEKYAEFKKGFAPLVKRFSRATEKMLLPALADGQMGLVIDAKLTSKQWIPLLPPSDKPMAMIEPALVLGVSDAALLRKAFGEYRVVLNKMLAQLQEAAMGQFPELKIPAPKTKKLTGGTLYYYPLPEELPIDKRILPNAGLGEKVAVLTITEDHSKRLLASTPLKVRHGPLADPKKPMSQALYFNWAELVTALGPWLELAIKASLIVHEVALADEGKDLEKHLEGILKQVRTGLEVLKVLRTVTSATYLEDGAWVTHTETVIRDLPAK
jgi:hypothetical protein